VLGVFGGVCGLVAMVFPIVNSKAFNT